MNAEPHFLIESLTRWDFGWRLSQTDGPLLLPEPLDFQSSVEAIHHMKRISHPSSCTLVLHLAEEEGMAGKAQLIEIRTPGMMSQNSAA